MSWSLDEVFPPGTRLDFSRPFLPPGLSAPEVEGLDANDLLALNQISGNAYLNLFGFVEEYILTATVQYLSAALFGERQVIRALSRFADEEVKHQALFLRFRAAFDTGVGAPCGVLENAVEVAGLILNKSPMGVLFTTLHIEWMTQQHYTACVQGDRSADPLFTKLLKCHWLEEAQHAKIDALELEKMVEHATPQVIEQAFEDYLSVLEELDGLLAHQSALDVESLSRRTGRTFSLKEHDTIVDAQHRAYRRTFLVFGLTNPQWAKIQGLLSSAGQERCQLAAKAYGA